MNSDLLIQTLTFIDRHRDQWRQSQWRRCFASHAAVLDGGEWAHPGADLWWLKARDDDPVEHVQLYGVDGEPVKVVHVRDRAARILGLSERKANRLFFATNDLGRLHVIVSELCEEAAA
jgi:uncharacterized iron-regulated membrane protein